MKPTTNRNTKILNDKRINETSTCTIEKMKQETGISYIKLLDLALFYFYKSTEYKQLVKITKIKE
jgi:hypothetical protein